MEWIKQYFLSVLKDHYFDFKGSVTRPQFWYFILISTLVSFLITIFVRLLGGEISNYPVQIYQLAIVLPTLSIGARRLHDADFSGWWQLLYILPLIGYIILIVLFCQPHKETNRFGGAA
jgi:uncharacterized membrane protein YhaH (DUF805 family)